MGAQAWTSQAPGLQATNFYCCPVTAILSAPTQTKTDLNMQVGRWAPASQPTDGQGSGSNFLS